jgi:hypothetical protein
VFSVRVFSLLALVLLALPMAGCDSTDNFAAVLSDDTLSLVAPTAGLRQPSAVDITAPVGIIGGPRFPEESQDALIGWDFALRLVGGELHLVPAGAIGLTGGSTRAGLTEAQTGKSFDDVKQAPSSSNFITTHGVAMRVGEVYVARSRLAACGFSSIEQYAKLQPLEVNVAAQRLKLRVATSTRCGDQRLVDGG